MGFAYGNTKNSGVGVENAVVQTRPGPMMRSLKHVAVLR